MIRKLSATTLALALVGGVYLTAQPAAASNMGFKLERDFPPLAAPARNIFYVSFPLFNGLGDVACVSGVNTAGEDCGTFGTKCVGLTGNSPTVGDGMVTAADALCDLNGSGIGTFTLQRFSPSACGFEFASMAPDAFVPGEYVFQNGLMPLPRDESFQVIVEYLQPGVQNQAVIVGSHDPSYGGRTISAHPGCEAFRQIALINLPYHTMYQNGVEILCGLEGVHWIRSTAHGNPIDPLGDPTDPGEPARCPNGIYDGAHTINVQTFDNVGVNAHVPCSVAPDGFTADPDDVNFAFGSDCYDLVPGEGYQVIMEVAHTDTLFLSPHF